jgi:hypothetical protein
MVDYLDVSAAPDVGDHRTRNIPVYAPAARCAGRSLPHMSDPLIIVVAENADRAGRFDAHHNGRYLCTSVSPFLDACRVLAMQGHDPESQVIMRHAGSDHDSLRGRLGIVAGLELSGHGFQKRKQQRQTASPIRSTDSRATSQPPAHENAQAALSPAKALP